jgi:hypothetical protein
MRGALWSAVAVLTGLVFFGALVWWVVIPIGIAILAWWYTPEDG